MKHTTRIGFSKNGRRVESGTAWESILQQIQWNIFQLPTCRDCTKNACSIRTPVPSTITSLGAYIVLQLADISHLFHYICINTLNTCTCWKNSSWDSAHSRSSVWNKGELQRSPWMWILTLRHPHTALIIFQSAKSKTEH